MKQKISTVLISVLAGTGAFGLLYLLTNRNKVTHDGPIFAQHPVTKIDREVFTAVENYIQNETRFSTAEDFIELCYSQTEDQNIYFDSFEPIFPLVWKNTRTLDSSKIPFGAFIMYNTDKPKLKYGLYIGEGRVVRLKEDGKLLKENIHRTYNNISDLAGYGKYRHKGSEF